MKKHPKTTHPTQRPHPGSVLPILDLFNENTAAAAGTSRTARKKKPVRAPVSAKRQRRGLTLRAGAGTPLWNILADALNAECKTHGAKAQLARHVGLPRQRMHIFLNGNGAMPDAERTLMLLRWLASRRQPATADADAAEMTPGKMQTTRQRRHKLPGE